MSGTDKLIAIAIVCIALLIVSIVYLENQSFQAAVKAGLVQKRTWNSTIWVKENQQDQ